MRIRRILLFALFVTLAVTPGCHVKPSQQTPPETAITTTNLLANPDFEADTWRAQCHYHGATDPLDCSTKFGEVNSPRYWWAWWGEGVSCHDGYVTGRPEYTLALKSGDPFRVFSGEKAAKLFTFWRCHDMGLLQVVSGVEPGVWYRFDVAIHSWYTRCSSKPHDGPLDSDCSSPLPEAHDILTVGIDPSGGYDPRSPSIMWSDDIEQYGVYGAQLSITAQTTGDRLTVFTRGVTTWPLKHNDIYVDAARLYRVHQISVPLAVR